MPKSGQGKITIMCPFRTVSCHISPWCRNWSPYSLIKNLPTLRLWHWILDQIHSANCTMMLMRMAGIYTKLNSVITVIITLNVQLLIGLGDILTWIVSGLLQTLDGEWSLKGRSSQAVPMKYNDVRTVSNDNKWWGNGSLRRLIY